MFKDDTAHEDDGHDEDCDDDAADDDHDDGYGVVKKVNFAAIPA